MQKNSIYTKYFNYVLKVIRQNGQLDIIRKRYSIAPNTYCKNLSKNDLALGYEKLTFLFIILIIGSILSFFIFMFEYKMKSDKKKELRDFSEEIEELEIQTRKLLDGSLKEKTGICLKRLLEEYDLS